MYLLNRFRRMSVCPSRRRNHRGSHPPIEGLETRSLLSGPSLVGALGSLEGTQVEHQNGSKASTQQDSPVRDEDIRNGGFSSSTVNAIREVDLRNGGFGSSTVLPLHADDFTDVNSDSFFDVWVELGKTGIGDDFCFPVTGDSPADGAVQSRIQSGNRLADGAVSNRGTAVGNPGDASLAAGNQNRLDEVTFTIAGRGMPGSLNPHHVGIPVYLDEEFQLPFDPTAFEGVDGLGDTFGMDGGVDMTALANLFGSMGGDSMAPGCADDDEGDPPYGGNDDSPEDDPDDTKGENEERRRREEEGPENEDDDHPNPDEDEIWSGMVDQIDAQFLSWLDEQMTAAHTQQIPTPAIDELRPW